MNRGGVKTLTRRYTCRVAPLHYPKSPHVYMHSASAHGEMWLSIKSWGKKIFRRAGTLPFFGGRKLSARRRKKGTVSHCGKIFDGMVLKMRFFFLFAPSFEFQVSLISTNSLIIKEPRKFLKKQESSRSFKMRYTDTKRTTQQNRIPSKTSPSPSTLFALATLSPHWNFNFRQKSLARETLILKTVKRYRDV